MSISKETLVDVLRIRYDAYSAEAVFQMACSRAGLEGKSELDARELAKFRDAVERVGDRVGSVLDYLDSMLGSNAPRGASGDASHIEPVASADEPEAQSDRSGAALGKSGTKRGKSDAKPATSEEASPCASAGDAGAESGAKPAESEASPSAHAGDTKAGGAHAAKPGNGDASDAKPGRASDAKPSSEKPGGETTIVCGAANAAAGELILVCGGVPELGDWDPARALPMTRQGEEWVTTVELAPGAEVAFKFLRRRKDGQITWEAGDNRLATGKRVAATWRSAT